MCFLQRVAHSLHEFRMSSRPSCLAYSMTIALSPFHLVLSCINVYRHCKVLGLLWLLEKGNIRQVLIGRYQLSIKTPRPFICKRNEFVILGASSQYHSVTKELKKRFAYRIVYTQLIFPIIPVD